MSEKQNKRFRKIARHKIDAFNSDRFVELMMALPFWTRLRFCLGIMLRKK